jgi:hypothetical protein
MGDGESVGATVLDSHGWLAFDSIGNFLEVLSTTGESFDDDSFGELFGNRAAFF